MRDIGKNIRTLRTQQNLTQDELAEKLFVTRQTVSNYETGRSRPDVEMLAKIAEALQTDANAVLYGPAPAPKKIPVPELLACCLLVLLLLFRKLAAPQINAFTARYFVMGFRMLIYCLLDPLIWLISGWMLTRLATAFLRFKPLQSRWTPWCRRILALLLALWLVISLAYLVPSALDDYLYATHRRGEWVEEPYEADGETVMGRSWQRIPNAYLLWMRPTAHPLAYFSFQFPWSLGLLGIGLCLSGFPHKSKQTNRAGS